MSDKKEAKTTKKEVKAAAKAKKVEQRKTAQVSRERLNRITKQKRHRIRSANRVMKYGAKSFVRNTWLSIAAIAIMTITLIILGFTVVATQAMDTLVHDFESKVDVSVYIKQSASRDEVEAIAEKIKNLESVSKISVVSPDEATNETIQDIIKDSGVADPSLIKNLEDAPVILPWTLNITMAELGDTEELKNFVDNDDSMTNMLDETQKPTYDSKDRQTIESISNATRNVRYAGFAAAGVFAVIAILVVFNTIRMAIFNRKEEIYMMRLVGAGTSFIIGPFLVEASIYGIVAAIIATLAIYGATYAFTYVSDFTSFIKPTFEIMLNYWYIAFACLLVLGILIGIISAALAARKYLKAK